MDCVETPDLGHELIRLYAKKTLDVRVGRRRLGLSLPFDVFSSFQLDRGTRALLARIVSRRPAWADALDLGCGYGPIALHLAAAGLAGHVDAIDRDALAVAFCRHNARTNGMEQVAAQGAVAYEGIQPAAYDAVVTNLPAKAGPAVHRLMLLGASSHLRPGGQVWAVVVAPLAEAIDEILADPAVEPIEKLPKGQHVLYGFGFTGRPELPDDPYLRQRAEFLWKKHPYRLAAWHGLKEFDTRSWATDLLLEAFEHFVRGSPVGRLTICNPQQGHLPILAARTAAGLAEVTLVSRDLLALRAATANLSEAGYAGAVRCVHTADFRCGGNAPPADVALAVLNEKEPMELHLAKLTGLLAAGEARAALVVSRSSVASRLERRLQAAGLRSSMKRKRKGLCALCFRYAGDPPATCAPFPPPDCGTRSK